LRDARSESRLTRRRLIRSLAPALSAWASMGLRVRAEAAGPVALPTQAGRYRILVSGLDRPERINHLHGFGLSLSDAGGRPLSGAAIVLTGQQRYALNPLPTSPQVRPGPAAGTYRVEGLRFHMAGDWRLVFTVEFEQIRDRAILDIVVK
jgi:hypothetical protein